jgi:hypothetical protein
MNIISALPDEPNDEGGLSATALKAKFDEPGNVMKAFINESLIPDLEAEINSEIGAVVLTSGNVPTGGTEGQILVKKSDADFDTEYRDPAPVPTAATIPISEAAADAMSLGSNASVEAGLLAVKEEISSLATSVPTTYVKKSGFVTGTFTMAATDYTEQLAKHINIGGKPQGLWMTLLSSNALVNGNFAAVNLPSDTYYPMHAGMITTGTTHYPQRIWVKFTATGFSVYNWSNTNSSFAGTWQYFAVL